MKRLCAIGLVLLNGMGSENVLLACGDKFVGAARGTRFQQAPSGRQETILIYINPASDVSSALSRVSVDAVLRREGYRPTTVVTSIDFDRELNRGGWDLILLDLANAQEVSQRAQNKSRILPVALKATGAELRLIKSRYPVVFSKAPTTDYGFLRVIYDALSSRSKGKGA